MHYSVIMCKYSLCDSTMKLCGKNYTLILNDATLQKLVENKLQAPHGPYPSALDVLDKALYKLTFIYSVNVKQHYIL